MTGDVAYGNPEQSLSVAHYPSPQPQNNTIQHQLVQLVQVPATAMQIPATAVQLPVTAAQYETLHTSRRLT